MGQNGPKITSESQGEWEAGLNHKFDFRTCFIHIKQARELQTTRPHTHVTPKCPWGDLEWWGMGKDPKAGPLIL